MDLNTSLAYGYGASWYKNTEDINIASKFKLTRQSFTIIIKNKDILDNVEGNYLIALMLKANLHHSMKEHLKSYKLDKEMLSIIIKDQKIFLKTIH